MRLYQLDMLKYISPFKAKIRVRFPLAVPNFFRVVEEFRAGCVLPGGSHRG